VVAERLGGPLSDEKQTRCTTATANLRFKVKAMKKSNQLLIGIAIIAAGACAGCATQGAASASTIAAPRSNETPRAVPVEVCEAKPNATASEQLIPAVLSIENTAAVLAQRDGIVTQLNGQEGARVAKGEIIARLNDADLRAQLRQAELEVERLTVEERQYEAMIKLNLSEFEQEQALAKDGLSSRRQLDRAQFKFDGAAQELEKTRLATQTARAKVEAVKIELEKTILRSPLAGVITRRHARLGANVVSHDKLFEVAQLAPLEVKFQLPQAEQRRLGPGQLVNLSLAESGRIVARARIRRLDPVADAASNTLGYLADVIGGAGLLPGLAVNVHIARSDAAVTVSIPQSAFPIGAESRGGMASTLFVIDGQQCALRTVWIKAVAGEQVEISSGLSAGERVILAPPAELKAGDPVQSK
jgi:HlyD family secretion protein